MSMKDRLFREILSARQRIYHVGKATPTEHLPLGIDAQVFLKREDLSPINSYKWRGAYSRMSLLSAEERERGVICASAGNHAQGVALAARRLKVPATIYMPNSTPRTKQAAVAKHGGEFVKVILTGDNFSQASTEAVRQLNDLGGTFIHAYDDLYTIAGQGTLADEAVMSGKGPFDIAYLQIGGGGMAAGVATWLKFFYPNIHIVGVEGVEQASMASAVMAGHPVPLPDVDVFCDGTAVSKVGELTFPICRDLIDEYITVTNEEVCAAIQAIWEGQRCLAEPSGAMGVAGILKQAGRLSGKRVFSVLCGANVDFGQLGWIVRHAGIGSRRRRYFRFQIKERPGTLVQLLETVLDGINIIEFQYGKTNTEHAYYVIGLEGTAQEFALLEQQATSFDVPFEDVTSQPDVEFRVIKYRPDLLSLPYFIRLEFPERAGALRDFHQQMRGTANICYFNYVYTGERVGRALLGFEFENEEERGKFKQLLEEQPCRYKEIPQQAMERML